MRKTFVVFALAVMLVLTAGLVSAKVSPSIWLTNTDCGSTGSDTDHYSAGETIYVHGSGFTANAYILGVRKNPFKPADIITPNQSKSVDSSGTFCFAAYTIKASDSTSGEYRVYFGDKHENFHIDNYAVVPEFGTTVGIATALGALGVFFLVRKK